MATYTTNYNLKKPDSTDPFGDFRGDYNDNLDIIDANLGGGGGSSSLAGLTDVDLTTPTDGQVLTYDSNNSKWINANSSGGGDSVSWSQLQVSGTKIAEIDINGVTTDVYSPSGGGGGNHIYSTSEQVVGEWTDGKPIYEKTWNFTERTVNTNTWVSLTGVSVANVDTPILCIARSSRYALPMAVDMIDNPVSIMCPLGNNEGRINSITLQYTKTTD